MKGDYVLDYHTCYLSFLNSTSEKIEGNTVSCCYLLKRSCLVHKQSNERPEL